MYVLIGAVCLGVTVFSVLWTWLHGRTLKRHNEETQAIYRKYNR
jgi:hypothetical protein